MNSFFCSSLLNIIQVYNDFVDTKKKKKITKRYGKGNNLLLVRSIFRKKKGKGGNGIQVKDDYKFK